jgi:hypothetical protein
MHKVVVERPRWNPGPGKRGRRANLPDELLPKCEGIRRPHPKRKGLADLLGPLKRWLRAQVGRPWDDVYGEACAVIKPDSVVRPHIKTHLLEFVQRHTFLKEGQVWCFAGRWGVQEMPVAIAATHWSPFHVDPATRLLVESPIHPRRSWRDKKAEHRILTQHWLNETTLIRRLNGNWFECRVEAFPRRTLKGDSPWRFDLAEKKLICRSNAQAIYGRNVHCVTKRQLSRRELRKFGVSNTNRAFNQLERSLQPVTAWLADDCASAFRRCAVHRLTATTTLNHGGRMANISFDQDSPFFRDYQQTSQRFPV